MKKEIQIACPCCKNKRLFDADPDTEGIIKIKCPICKGVIAVSFHSKRIRTERIGAWFIHSDQVFIFSTNEEIVGDNFEIMKPVVQATFLLENVDNSCTKIKANEYFEVK